MSRSAWGVVVATFFAIAAWITPVPERWRTPLVVLTWVALAFACIGWLLAHMRLVQRLRSSRKATRPMTLVLIGLVGAALSIAVWLLVPKLVPEAELRPSPNEEKKTEPQPYISTNLVIDSAEEKKTTGHSLMTAHFHIVSGSAPQSQLTIRHANWDISGTGVWGGSRAENVSNLPRDLPPTQGLDVSLTPMLVLDARQQITVILYVYYSPSGDKNLLLTRSTYRFLFLPRNVRSQTVISPMSSSVDRVEYDAGSYRPQNESRFAAKKGIISAFAAEIENGKPNVKTLIENSQRRIFFDANLRTVRFETKVAADWVVIGRASLREGKNGIHLIMAVWNGDHGLLFVDATPDEMKAHSAEAGRLLSKP